MPEFPRAHSERELTTQRPGALHPGADIRTDAAERSKAAQAGVDSLTKNMLEWQAAVEEVQHDTALYNYKVGLQNISNDAVNDTNLKNEPAYHKRIEDLKNQTLESVDSEILKKKMAPEIGYMEAMGSLGIRKEFRQKVLIHGQKVSIDNLELLTQNPGPDTAENIELAVADAVKKGRWNEVAGQALEKKYKSQARENAFIRDINNDPAAAEKNLMKNAYGFTVQELESAGKVYEREVRTVQDNNEKSFMEMKINGTLSEGILRDAIAKKKIDPKVGAAMIKDVNIKVQPKATELDKAATYNKLTVMRDAIKSKDFWLFSDSTFAERAKYRAAVFEAHASGQISENELNEDFLTNELNDRFYKDKTFVNAIKQVNSLSDQYQSKESKEIAKYSMSRDLTKKVMNGMDPEEALQVVSAERIQQDFPDVKAADLMATAKKYNKPVWEIYKLTRKK